jgi:cyclophilin family peptidyl-prolyl cis-trans isomerase
MRKLFYLFASGLILTYGACKKTENPSPTPEATEKIIEITTAHGTMYMWLYRQTPLHRENFLTLAAQGFFDSTIFHRIVPGFVIQGGDPLSKDSIPGNDGTGGPGYTIPAEFVDSLKHVFGAVGAARDNNPAKASNGSQFYVVVDPNGEPGLDRNYTVFGRVFAGMDAASNIVSRPRDARDRPRENIYMQVKVLEKTHAELKTEFGFTPDPFR